MQNIPTILLTPLEYAFEEQFAISLEFSHGRFRLKTILIMHIHQPFRCPQYPDVLDPISTE